MDWTCWSSSQAIQWHCSFKERPTTRPTYSACFCARIPTRADWFYRSMEESWWTEHRTRSSIPTTLILKRCTNLSNTKVSVHLSPFAEPHQWIVAGEEPHRRHPHQRLLMVMGLAKMILHYLLTHCSFRKSCDETQRRARES